MKNESKTSLVCVDANVIIRTLVPGPFLRIPTRLSSRRAIFPLAWRLAQEFHRPRAYDMTYVALAQLRHCELWTADERLYNAVSDKLPWVKWIGHFQPDGR